MALEEQNNKQEFIAVQGETSFTFNIPYFDASDITVKIQSVAGVISTPSFTLSPTNGDTENGGIVVLTTGANAGDRVVIIRTVPLTQQYDLKSGATLDPTALNKALDRIVAQNQQQEEVFDRTIQHPETDPSTTTYTVGTTVERANKALGYDAAGNVTELSLLASGTIGVNENNGLTKAGNLISCKADNTSIGFNASGEIEVKDGGVDSNELATDSVVASKIDDGAVTFSKLSDVSTDLSTDSSATKVPTADAAKTYSDLFTKGLEFVVASAGTIALTQTTPVATGTTSYQYNVADFEGTFNGDDIDPSDIRFVYIDASAGGSAGDTRITASMPNGSLIGITGGSGSFKAYGSLTLPVTNGQNSFTITHTKTTSNDSDLETTILGYLIKT